ncbi:MAG: leucyl aminopeptidase [Flavobacteriales bacterium]|nr:leucyl aminopeptidase [Flavobacteriales bacterium]
MMHSPLRLHSTDATGDMVIHLIATKGDIARIALPEALAAKLKEKVGKDELVYVIPSENGTTVVVKAKLEEETSYRNQAYRALGAKLCKLLNTDGATAATLLNTGVLNKDYVLQLCEGMALANYQFLTYRTGDKAKPNSLKELMVSDPSIAQDDLAEVTHLVAATCIARDLVNEPPATLTATELGKRVMALGTQNRFEVKVMGRKRIAELGMGGLLGVNKGSVEEPAFIVMDYRPDNAINSSPIVLVGKGVTYDTGGYDIKHGGNMRGMKCDMAGAAAVAGAISAVAANRLPVHVVGLVPATDNRIDGKATVADDVLLMMSGATVEVQNTDAEGRLVLADALHYAKQYAPELVIDLATLTGAAARITAHHGIGMSADKAPQKELLMKSGEEVYERMMEFPLWREFHDAIKSDVADIRNMGGAAGGNITAATFLHYFTDYPWIHLDIAGPSMMETESDYRLKGATGVGVRLLYRFMKNYSID